MHRICARPLGRSMGISGFLASLVLIGALSGCREEPRRASDPKKEPLEPAQDAPLSTPPPLKWGPTLLRLARSGQIEEEKETFGVGDAREPHFLRQALVPGWEVVDATGKVMGGIRSGPTLGVMRGQLAVILLEGPLLSIDPETGEHYQFSSGLYFESPDCSGDAFTPPTPEKEDEGMPILAFGRVWVPVPTTRIHENTAVFHGKSTLDDDGRCRPQNEDTESWTSYRRGPRIRWSLPLRLARVERD